MTQELVVTTRCNLACTYCYQNPMREAGNVGPQYNVGKMLGAVTSKFSLFGGEPLLMAKKDLEIVFSFGWGRFKENAIQTNGVLIDAEHIDLFKRHHVGVGISMDGPGPLNSARVAAGSGMADEATEKVWGAIQAMVRAGVVPSIICTLHWINGGASSVPRMIEWFRELEGLGIIHVNLHLLEVDDVEGEKLRLEESELIQTLLAFYEFSKTSKLIFSIFDDITKRMKGDYSAGSCVWHGCDPYTTEAVQGIDGDGTLSNCGRTNKDGVAYRKASVAGKERTALLLRTPQQDGGCKGCEFWDVCQGYCPGTARDGDWRNRTEHCGTLLALFNRVKEEGGFTGRKDQGTGLVNIPHGDIPHGDSWYVTGTKDAPIRF